MLGPFVTLIALTGSLQAHGDASVGQALLLMPGVDQIAKSDLGVVVNRSGVMGGYTFTVQRIYMDLNRFVLSFRVTGPRGRPFVGEFYTSPVVSVGGQTLKRDEGMGGPIDSGAQDLYYAYDYAYDANPLSKLVPGSMVPARIMVPYVRAFEQVGSNSPPAVSGEMYQQLGDGVRQVSVQGPLTFDVNVPVDPRVKSLNVGRTLTSKPSPIRLDRVVATPTYTRIFFQGGDPNVMLASVAVNGQDISQYLVGPWRDAATGETEFGLNAALFGQRGSLSIVARPYGRYSTAYSSAPVEVPLN